MKITQEMAIVWYIKIEIKIKLKWKSMNMWDQLQKMPPSVL